MGGIFFAIVVETLSLDTINANSLQSLLQTLQKLRVGTERVRSWYGASLAMMFCGEICKNMAKSLEDTR